MSHTGTLMLGLLAPTDSRWVEIAERDLDSLLSDHAHCEIKAAQAALGLMARFAGEYPDMVAPLVALVREESEHFVLVQDQLRMREQVVMMPRSDDYVNALRKTCRVDSNEHPVLLDRLLISALVEARSCERFQLLSQRLKSVELRTFYEDLMASEARHYRLFVRLAEERFGINETRARLATLCEREATLAVNLALGPSVHG